MASPPPVDPFKIESWREPDERAPDELLEIAAAYVVRRDETRLFVPLLC